MSMRFLVIVRKQVGTFLLAMLTVLFFGGSAEAGIGSAQKRALDSDSILHADGSRESVLDDNGTGDRDGDGDDNGTGNRDGDGDDNGTGDRDGD